MIKQERHLAELAAMEMKLITTRKLWRRANDPAGLRGFGNGEKRSKPNKATLRLLLKEEEVFNKSKALDLMKSPASPARSPSPGGSSSPSIQGKDAKIEDGKLFYEKRWFRPFQYVTVNWKDGPSYEAVISAIGSEAIWVRKIGDNAKVCMYVTRLVKDGDGEDCRYDLYNYEYQFNTGGANSSCGKVIQITAIDRDKSSSRMDLIT